MRAPRFGQRSSRSGGCRSAPSVARGCQFVRFGERSAPRSASGSLDRALASCTSARSGCRLRPSEDPQSKPRPEHRSRRCSASRILARAVRRSLKAIMPMRVPSRLMTTGRRVTPVSAIRNTSTRSGSSPYATTGFLNRGRADRGTRNAPVRNTCQNVWGQNGVRPRVRVDSRYAGNAFLAKRPGPQVRLVSVAGVRADPNRLNGLTRRITRV
jgi:hypothetical protein